MSHTYRAALARAARQALTNSTTIILPFPDTATDNTDHPTFAKNTVRIPLEDAVRELIYQAEDIVPLSESIMVYRAPEPQAIKAPPKVTYSLFPKTTLRGNANQPTTNSPRPQPLKPPPPVVQSTAPPERQTAIGTRDFDKHCLDFVKSHNVRKLLKTAYVPDRQSTVEDIPNAIQRLHLFRSVCVCDPKLTGQPIRYKSRYFSLSARGLKVGACEFLNLTLDRRRLRKPMLDLFPRPGPDGRPTFVLEYAANLLSEESLSAEPAFVLACQVDCTELVKKLVYQVLAEQDRRGKADRRGIDLNHRDSGVFISCSDNTSSLNILDLNPYTKGPIREVRLEKPLEIVPDARPASPVDWLEVDQLPLPPKQDMLLPAAVSQILRTLLQHVLVQYEHCFILSPTATLGSSADTTSSSQWQISYTSQTVHGGVFDLRVALSNNAPEVLLTLGSHLAGHEEVRMPVVWGVKEESRILQAVPMMRGRNVGVGCWLCFLLEEN